MRTMTKKMMKNKMLDIAKKLGLELGEVFMIDYGNKTNNGLWYDNFFKFTEEGLKRVSNRWQVSDSYIEDLISGKAKVIKFWRPKNGEKYYVPSISSCEGYRSHIWSEDGFSGVHFYKEGVICKTPKEALDFSTQIFHVIRKLLIYKKRMENSDTKDVGEYDYLSLFG